MDQTPLSSTGIRAGFAQRVSLQHLSGGSYLVLPVATPDIVSFQGSFLNIPDFADGEGLLRDLTVSMLDKGTKSRTKTQLSEELEGIGAHLNFVTDGVRIRFSGKALKHHLAAVLSILAEEVSEPTFPQQELDLLKGRFEGALRRSLTSTSMAASGALSRRVYDPGHPNHSPHPLSEIDRLAKITLDDVVQFFETRFKPLDWRMAIVGDVSDLVVGDFVSDLFPLATQSKDVDYPSWECADYAPAREEIHVQDRDNIDVRFGQPIQLKNTDPDYVPLYVGNYILGGNFSARLMSEIRDRMGLTYGIHSSLADVDALHHGMWAISVTLSRANLEKGIAETMNQIRLFAENGVTEDELTEMKTTVAGSFKVGLSSTGALARTLLRNAEKNRDPGYLDRFPGIINELDVDTVNQRILDYLRPDRLHIALSGSVHSEP